MEEERLAEQFRAYAKLVREMRKHQFVFFTTSVGSKERNQALDKAKAMEKQVDKFQLPWEDISDKQTTLF